MKEILYLHPAGQALTFLFGVFNLLTGLTRRMFNIALHINCGAIYYFSTLLGAAVGFFMAKWAERGGMAIDMEFHEVAAMVMVLLAAAGSTTGLAMRLRPVLRSRLLRFHRWINALSVAIFCAQGVTGIIQLVKLI